MAPAIYALPLLVALADLKVGRDLLFAESMAQWSWLLGGNSLLDVGWNVLAVRGSVMALATVTSIAWAFCWWRSGRPMGEFRSAAACIVLFAGGLLLCFLNPVFSMTNPPVNWGYPRTEEGFAHVLSRGQFDSFAPPPDVSKLGARLSQYGRDLVLDVGPMYLVAAALTLSLWRRAPALVRRWIAGMWVMWSVVTVISVAALNVEQREIGNVRALFTPGIVVLMILAGCGVALAACGRNAITTDKNVTGTRLVDGQRE